MSERYTITPPSLEVLFDALARDGARVVAPRQTTHGVELGDVRTPRDVATGYVQAITSAKGVVFPKVERILGYRTQGRDVALEDPTPDARPTVLFGLRPCEARAFAALEALFNWGERDAFFNERRQRTAIVSVVCTEADEACFCTSLGSGPADPAGSDLQLHPLADGGYAADVRSEKGRALVALLGDRAAPLAPEAALAEPARVEAAFAGNALPAVLATRFDDPVWAEQSLRCLGCGVCAFVCPTCACFDLQDEADAGGGQRLRCWDSCGLSTFTLHASGHNPRERQSQRWRQRVYHKFAYYPDRLGMLGCVGCGKCSRACPADMSLKEHLAQVARSS